MNYQQPRWIKMKIRSHRDAMAEAVRRWSAGSADGWPWDGVPDGAVRILGAERDDEVDVYRLPDGSEVAVGDANGPWAVEITPAIERAARMLGR